ncbi:MAG: DNA polymerase II, partial [Spirochaetae bacterium HGW-Spirochaetae-7]
MGQELRGLGLHLYADHRRGCVFVVGRLADGRSFAAEDRSWRPTVYLGAADAARAEVVALGYSFAPCGFEAIDGSSLLSWTAPGFGAYRDAAERLAALGCAVHGGGSMADLYRADRRLGLGLRVSGEERPGKRVDVVLADAAVEADDEANAPVSVLSLDIETDETDRSVRAASLSMADWSVQSIRLVRRPAPTRVLIVAAGTVPRTIGTNPRTSPDIEIEVQADERGLITALRDRIVALDPDVVTGWNIVEFDLARLLERAGYLGISFDIGRSDDGARLLPKGRGRTATAIVPGRQVIDAMRVARSGPERYDDYRLETVARVTLGRGKAVSMRGPAKIAELDRLYRDDIVAFIEYSAGDAALVLDLLQATGLFALTLARARLVRIGLDRAWTSVAAFERAYGEALRSRGVVPPPFIDGRDVSGAAGGTVLPARAGYRDGVVVLDFKSLYPSVMRTFGIDPMSNARSGAADAIVAPNGARFARESTAGRWPLPALVDEYFERREEATARGDATASFVYKILMNSFYGVLGTSSCRYARTELAGAVTSFGKSVLMGAKARIEREGFEVLYGDTDSLFVATGLGSDASYAVYRETGDRL